MADQQPQIVVVQAPAGESVPHASASPSISSPRGILKKRERKRDVPLEV